MDYPLQVAVKALHYACALATSLYVPVTIFLDRRQKGAEPAGRWVPRAICCSLLVASYVGEIVAVADIESDPISTSQAHLVHLVVGALIWAGLSTQNLVSGPVLGTALLSVAFEAPIAVLTRTRGARSDVYNIPSTALQAVRGIIFCALAVLALKQRRASGRTKTCREEEAQPLLPDEDETPAAEYGTVPSSDEDEYDEFDDEDPDSDDDAGDTAKIKKRRAELLKEKGGWIGYLKDFSIFIPYLIPKHDRKVQFCYLVCILCLIAGRVLNILIPRQLGIVTDRLVDGGQAPYGDLATWLLLSLLRHESGIDFIEALAKIPIEQFSYRQVTNAAFNHVMSLPMEFHAERDSAEVMKAIEQGNSLTNLLRVLVLEVVPTVVDLVVALAFLYYKFNIFASIVLLAAGVAFVVLQVVSSTWNLDNRRDSTRASREETRVMHQAVQGWQTVTYFNMFRHESRRFGAAVEAQLEANRRYQKRSACLEAVVEAIVPVSFFLLGCLVLYEISSGDATPGDFVFLMQYWEYIIWPIKWFSHTCRYLMTDLVDAERLLALLQTKSSISDREGAKSVPRVEGHVAFESVDFSYDARKPTVRNLSMRASPGETVALVGETGAGKSTILKLLLRFYDVTSGRITIDGHDIRDVTLDSLRGALGVVPQDPLLFNASVLENLRYARPDATEAEIRDACRAAAIHDKILSFPDGYATVVGEQGVKLSGGEIQRIAIARVFLKDPPVLILDEATSAVDSHTEASIQRALEVLKRGRTTFVIAHRLSTVVRSQRILVVHEGRVVESGTHDELMRAGGRYHGLWTSQTASGAVAETESLI